MLLGLPGSGVKGAVSRLLEPPEGVKGLSVLLPPGVFPGVSLLLPGSGVTGATSWLVPPPVGDGVSLLEPAGGVTGVSLLLPGSGVTGTTSRLVPPPVGDGVSLLEPGGGVTGISLLEPPGVPVPLPGVLESLGVDGIPVGLASFGALLPGTWGVVVELTGGVAGLPLSGVVVVPDGLDSVVELPLGAVELTGVPPGQREFSGKFLHKISMTSGASCLFSDELVVFCACSVGNFVDWALATLQLSAKPKVVPTRVKNFPFISLNLNTFTEYSAH